MGKRVILVFLMAVVTLSVYGQKVTVSGLVTSLGDGRSISGASVAAEGCGVMVVTNGDGFFTLKTDSLPRAVVVSHLGYESRRVELGNSLDGPLKISLKPTAILLSEVLVVANDPRELVMAAIRKIPKNYSLQPELHRCFYRETAMKRQHYICVAEGVVDMYKTAYGHGTGRDRVAIRKGRRLLSPRQTDTLSVKVMGGPVGPVQLDMVKNLELLFNTDELDLYELKMELPEMIADRQQYVVSIAPRATVEWPLYFGKLYIDRETLAFSRIDLSLDMSDREKATRMMLVKKPAGVRFRPKELSLLIDYRLGDDDLSRISYVRTTFRFNCDWRRRLFATSFTAVCEMVVTNTQGGTDVQPIRGRESFDQRDAFFDQVAFFRDPAFWQDYNIIEPTESLDRAIERIVKKY